ncbi:hypothetical protein LCGC14_1789500 [marine sediment metagenome]|uniref:Tyr recombinase domain-containing protein n=1 Tax=marine sediment metagenome TaxID=412755 RepID=A0A0F9J7V5_9ZZZZ
MKVRSDRERIPVGDRVVICRRGRKQIYNAEFSEGGVHRRKSLRTSSKKVAMKRATELAAQLETGEFKPTPRTKIRRAVAAYIAFLVAKDRARKTIVRYRGELNTFADFAEANNVYRLDQITASVFDKYRAHRGKDHKPATIYHESVIVKQLLKWSRRRDLIKVNPIVDYELEKPKREGKSALTLKQVNTILSECTPRQRRMIAMLAFTGMRVSSLQAQRLEWIEWNIGRMKYHDVKKRQIVENMPIHQRLAAELASLTEGDQELLFTAAPSPKYPKGGRPVNAKRLNEYFKMAAQRAGITAFTLHDLRRFFKTFTVNASVPERAVDQWLNHSDGSVRGIYYHLSWEESRRFMDMVRFDREDGDDHDIQE